MSAALARFHYRLFDGESCSGCPECYKRGGMGAVYDDCTTCYGTGCVAAHTRRLALDLEVAAYENARLATSESRKRVMPNDAGKHDRDPRPYMNKAARREVLLVADGIEGAFSDDKDAAKWVKRLRRVAR